MTNAKQYLLDADYRESECARSRDNHRANADGVNAARRKKYHDPKKPLYREQALARARKQAERRRKEKQQAVTG